jgi:4-diphosphocytidyl-2-C-methyl-D-erythritol kinase
VSAWEAPAKLNLSLEIRARDESGLHALRSIAQTISWLDLLEVEESGDDSLVVEGFPVPEGGDNLVWKAVEAAASAAERPRPQLDIRLTKRIAVAAGLGGGSSDAAAALLAMQEMLRLDRDRILAVAPMVGSDVPFLITGGLATVEGHGEAINPLPPISGFAVAVAVPFLELSTVDVYRAWDDLGEPQGRPIEARRLPPALRAFAPLRNDLTPAVMHLAPSLGDLVVDLARAWETPVSMTGSGPALFAYFGSAEEASSAVAAIPWKARAAVGCELRPHGPAPSGE